MANSKLVGRKFTLNSNVVLKMKQSFGNVLSDRIHNYISTGYMTYDDMKNYLRDYLMANDGVKNELGGNIFYNWVKSRLNHSREIVKNTKKIQTDVGFNNKHIKPHEKNGFNTAHTKKNLYENFIKKQILIEIEKNKNE